MAINLIIQQDSEEGVAERDSRYCKEYFPEEPHNVATTVKLTESLSRRLVQFSRQEGYTTLGPAIRELIQIGLKYYGLEAIQNATHTRDRFCDDPIVKKFFSDAR